MIDALSLLLVLLAGVALGLVFFGGLWWTVRRGLASPRPALWFIGSLIVRVALTLGGIYMVAGDQWPRLCAAKRRWDPNGILAPGFIQYE